MTSNSHYRCISCGKEISTTEIIYRCPVCSQQSRPGQPPEGLLKVIYDYSGIRKEQDAGSLFRKIREARFLSLLPLKQEKSLGYLRVGNTPVYAVRNLDGKDLDCRLYFKDDSQNPTFSLKDRASVLVSALARENGIDTLVTASTGNAGSSLAGICASQHQKAVVLVPASAPPAKLLQIVIYGATLVPVDGNYDTAFDLSLWLSDELGWYNRNTAWNPFTVEGKKIAAFEIAEQLDFKVPGRIFIPVGDGVILSGMYKGFEELLQLGIIERMPVLVAVQSENSDNLTRNLHSPSFHVISSTTLADSISVDIPRGFFMVKHYVDRYGGESITVSDSQILQAAGLLSRNTGIFTEPASAAAFAGFLKMKSEALIEPGSSNLVLLTGAGLKDPKPYQQQLRLPEPVEPDKDQIIRYLKINKVI